MTGITFDALGLAQVAGIVTVYSYDGETREYTGESDEYLAVGIGIPANSTIVQPEAVAIGRVVVFNSGAWSSEPDHRGETVYATTDGSAVVVTALGDYPAETTTLKPVTPYDQWDGDAWVTDVDAQKSAQVAQADMQKQVLTNAAMQSIDVLQLKLRAGRTLTDAENMRLNAVLDYIDAVNAVDTSTAPDITWPTPPNA